MAEEKPRFIPGRKKKYPARAYFGSIGGFDDHAKAIGLLVHDWNILQDTLMGLFCTFLESDDVYYHDVASNVWHAIRSDSSQRDVLKAAAQAY